MEGITGKTSHVSPTTLPRRRFILQSSLALAALCLPSTQTIEQMTPDKQPLLYDAIIVGGSYAGLAAALALGRSLRQVLVIDSGSPCNRTTPYSHNFLTQDGVAPDKIALMGKQQVEKYGTIRMVRGVATQAIRNPEGFSIKTFDGTVYECKMIVLATGIRDLLPPIPGLAECWGISVLHCPYCHGYEVRKQNTALLANGSPAFEMAALLTNWTGDLTLCTDGPSSLSPAQSTQLTEAGVMIIEDRLSTIRHENGYINGIAFESGRKLPVKALYHRPLFEQHSRLGDQFGCERTEEGYIRIDGTQQTTVPGIYACGDNSSRMRTVANAIAAGTAAGMMLNKALINSAF